MLALLDGTLRQRRWKVEPRSGRAEGTIGDGYWIKDVYGEEDGRRLAYLKIPLLMGVGIAFQMFDAASDALLFRGEFHTRKRVTLNGLGMEEFTYTINNRDGLAVAAGKMAARGAGVVGFSNQTIQVGSDRARYSGVQPLVLERGTLTLDGGPQVAMSYTASRLVLTSDEEPIPLTLAAAVLMSVIGSTEIRMDKT